MRPPPPASLFPPPGGSCSQRRACCHRLRAADEPGQGQEPPQGPGSPHTISAGEPTVWRARDFERPFPPTAACPKPSSSLEVWGCLAWTPRTSKWQHHTRSHFLRKEESAEAAEWDAGSESPSAWGQDGWEEKDTVQRRWPSSTCDCASSCLSEPGCQPTGVRLAHPGTRGELQAGKSPPGSPQFSSPFI